MVGRFISEDPIGLKGGDLNLYAYVINNPINWIDPFGLVRVNPNGGATGLNPGRGEALPGGGGGRGGSSIPGNRLRPPLFIPDFKPPPALPPPPRPPEPAPVPGPC